VHGSRPVLQTADVRGRHLSVASRAARVGGPSSLRTPAPVAGHPDGAAQDRIGRSR
jgi:hypothetical protein